MLSLLSFRECERLEKSLQNQLLLQERLEGANSSLAAQEKLLHQLQQAVSEC